MSRHFIAGLVLAGLSFATVALAEMRPPSGPVLLTVTGAIETTNAEGAAVFDRDMLERLDWREVETHTSFTEGGQKFAGPTLSSVLDSVGAAGANLVASAINDYAVEFPIAMAREHDALLALDHNGKPMRIRDKGPIWIVFPLSKAEAEDKPFDTEMVWQLVRLDVKP